MTRRPPIISCGRCGRRFPSWEPTRLCGTCPNVPAPPDAPRLASGLARGQLSLLDDAAPPLPVRDGSQWLELPGETWEDIFFQPETAA